MPCGSFRRWPGFNHHRTRPEGIGIVQLTRSFIEVDGRLVHMASAGSGPVVALLHESPRSYAALLPLMEMLAPRRTVLAFDTPGFGQSEPLAIARPDLADFGDALVATLAALGLRGVPVYGTHTGSGIALEAALRHPEVVAGAVLDGYSIWTEAEREDMLREYLPSFAPLWDGSHLTRLWSRIRDQYTFFPWYRFGNSGRLPGDPQSLEKHQQVALDMLHAGDHYKAAYAASLGYDAEAAARKRPDCARYLCRSDDLLFHHLDRLPAEVSAQAVTRLGADRAAWGAFVAEALPPGGAVPRPFEQPHRRRYLTMSGRQIHLRRFGENSNAEPILLLHGVPGSSRTVTRLASLLGRGRIVDVPDLPGCGQSDPAADADDFPALVETLVEVVDGLGHEHLTVVGIFTGATLAGALALRLDGRVRRVALIDPPPATPDATLIAHYPLAPVPRWDGTHLQAAWMRHRDALLYAPWYDRSRASARPLEATPDPVALQDQVIATLEGAAHETALCRAILSRMSGPITAPSRSFALAPARPLAKSVLDWLETS
jgi:pimeloyl-ACP methyl ester carboxylesterase